MLRPTPQQLAPPSGKVSVPSSRNFSGNLSRLKAISALAGSITSLQYPQHIVTCYAEPPTDGFVGIWTFQEAAAARLSVLQAIANKFGASEAIAFNTSDQTASAIEALLKEKRLRIESANVDAAELLQRDRLSHFILRLAFSVDRSAREWFVKQESRLLQLRLNWLKYASSSKAMGMASGFSAWNSQSVFLQSLQDILVDSRMEFTPVNFPANASASQKALWDDIFQSTGYNDMAIALKVPFWPDAATLLRGRRCYLKGGYAYVPLQDVSQLLLNRFRRILNQSFEKVVDKSGTVQRFVFDDNRIGPFVKSLHTAYLGPQYSGRPGGDGGKDDSIDRLSLNNIQMLSERSFPPCMRHLYLTLKKHHHLKHWGRLQLWLFQKGAGMTMDEQIQLWRGLWRDPVQFDKEHAYNVRHAYGQEGKRSDYTPLSCSKIINGNAPIGAEDHHGCPFRHFDPSPLSSLLMSMYKLTGPSLRSVLNLVETRQHQLACLEVFKATHKGSEGDGVGNHPNSFYVESCKFHNSRRKIEVASETPSGD